MPTPEELLDEYLQILQISGLDDEAVLRDKLSELTEHDISSLLVVVTGMVKIGSERFHDIFFNRLVRTDRIESSYSEHRQGTEDILVQKIFSVLQAFFERPFHAGSAAERDKWAQRSRQMVERANWRDAKALHAVLTLNNQRNKNRELFLYLSSSHKSSKLFLSSVLKNEWPIIEGVSYDLVRHASDLFAYMVYRGESDDPVERAKEAVTKLGEVQELIKRVEAVRTSFQSASERCAHCNLAGEARCDLQSYCVSTTIRSVWLSKTDP